MKDLNKKLISLIREYGDDRTAALNSCVDLDCFMALSPLRENLLEWYEFQADGELLQVGADYGALTGLFKRRVKAVTVWDESEEQLDIVRERFPDTSEGAPVSAWEVRCGSCFRRERDTIMWSVQGAFKSLRTSGRKSCGIWQSLAER